MMDQLNIRDFTVDEIAVMCLVGTLKPKTQKGKQRIKQWGDRGKIMRVVDKLVIGDGPWFAICAGDKTWRWVHGLNDKDFELILEPWPNMPEFMKPNTHDTEDH